MRGIDPGAQGGRVRSSSGPVRPSGQRPGVVVWEADGALPGRRGYGAAVVARLAAAGIAATTVPLTERRPSPDELAARVHVLSGGVTPATSDRGWVARARRDLVPVLERARTGEAVVTGICFGAQLIAATLAGPDAVGPHPRGIEAGLTVVRPTGPGPDPAGLAPADGIVVAELHHHRIDPSAVAGMGGVVSLANDHTFVQAFTAGAGILGLQFHPELDPVTMRAVVRSRRHLIRAHGGAPAAALSSIDRLGGGWRAATFDRLVAQPALRLLVHGGSGRIPETALAVAAS